MYIKNIYFNMLKEKKQQLIKNKKLQGGMSHKRVCGHSRAHEGIRPNRGQKRKSQNLVKKKNVVNEPIQAQST